MQENALTLVFCRMVCVHCLLQAYINSGQFEAAKGHCKTCQEIAAKLNNPSLLSAAKQCLKDLREEEEKAKNVSDKS